MKTKENFRFEKNTISIETLKELYAEIGWGKNEDYPHLQQIHANESCQYYSLYVDDHFVGFSKVVTDGYSFSLLVEIVIKPSLQGKGYGSLLLDYTEQQIPTNHLFLHSIPGNKDFFLHRNYKESTFYHLFLKKIS